MSSPRPILSVPPRELARALGWFVRDWLTSLGVTVGELRQENAALREEIERLRGYESLAYHDPLTGLRNRRFFDERLTEELARARREPGRPLSLLVLDIDDFKSVNDRHGHPAGDALLRWFGGFLRHELRDFDLRCRIGGDEFAILLPETPRDGAMAIVSRLQRRLAAENRRRRLPVSVSVGVATAADGACRPNELLAAADAAMYRAKRARGRQSRVGVSPPSTTHICPIT